MSVFRNGLEYNNLLRRFELAVGRVWPEYLDGEPEISKLSSDPKDLECLVVASYKLMKYIRRWLTKQKLPFDEGGKYPNLYNALEEAVRVTQARRCTLAVEADKLESVSRAAYHWMKTYKMVTPKPLSNPVPRRSWCQVCKTEPATADGGLLCSECSGEAASANPLNGSFDDMGFPLDPPLRGSRRDTEPTQGPRVNQSGDMAFQQNRFSRA